MRTVTSERLAIFLVQTSPRATCSHHSFAIRTPRPQRKAKPMKMTRHSALGRRENALAILAGSANVSLRLRIVTDEKREVVEREEKERRQEDGHQTGTADAPP